MKKKLYYLIFSALCLCSCVRTIEPQQVASEPAEQTVISAIPGKAYVMFSEEVADKIAEGGFEVAVPEIGVKSCKRIFPENPNFSKRYRAAGLNKWYVIEYDENVSATKAMKSLDGCDGVEAVSFPNRLKKNSLDFPFNDPYNERQWSLSNDGRLNAKLKTEDFAEGCDINVLPVWENYTTGSKDIIVAVLDGGVNLSHEDLAGVVLPAGEGGSRNFAAGDPFLITPNDHGSNVASIIGAVNNNNIGMSSVAGGKDGKGGVRIMSCQLFVGEQWGSDEDNAAAFVWAADNGAVICNNSWGFIFKTEADAKESAYRFNHSQSPVRSGIDYFIKYAGMDDDGNQVGPVAGGTVIFSSGNDGYAYGVPACYEPVIAVAAHGPNYNLASYSNFGDWVDIIAPGGDFERGSGSYDNVYRSIFGADVDNSGYCFMSGTSQAAPHVTGVAALLASYFAGQGFTNAMLRERLILGARKGAIPARGNTPMLDAYGAFTFVPSGVVSISTTYEGDYTLKSHESMTVEYEIEGNMSLGLPVSIETDSRAISYETSRNKATLYFDALYDEPGKYPVKIYVGKGTKKEVSLSFIFTILENHAPVVQNPIDDIVISTSGSTVSLANVFVDPDGESLKYSASTDSKLIDVNVQGANVSIVPHGYGMAEITVSARDARNASASQTFKVLVRNTAKQFDIYPNPVEDFMFVRPGSGNTTIDVVILDSFGGKVLTESVSASPFSPAKMDLSNFAPGSYMVKVKDASGKELEQNIVKL